MTNTGQRRPKKYKMMFESSYFDYLCRYLISSQKLIETHLIYILITVCVSAQRTKWPRFRS